MPRGRALNASKFVDWLCVAFWKWGLSMDLGFGMCVGAQQGFAPEHEEPNPLG